jgi:hypothetical protein
MADIFLSPRLRFASNQFRYIDSTGMTRGIYTGAIETTAYGGDRFGASLTSVSIGGQTADGRDRRAQLLTWLASLKGKQNRAWLPDHAYRQRGSFSAPELLSNGLFRDVTGWAGANGASLTAIDDTLRVTLGGATANPQAGANVAVTGNVPYVVRAFLRSGRGTTLPALQASDGVASSGVAQVSDGLAIVTVTPTTTPLALLLYGAATNNIQAGDFFESQYVSVSRCALVDNGANLLLQSDTPGGTSWGATNMTTAVSGTDPSGLTTAYALTETTANGNHLVSQSATVAAAAADFALSFYVKKGIRTFCQLLMTEATGSTQLSSSFDANTGVVGATQATGANWSNLRTFVEACGNGWFRFTIVGRKTNAATSIGCYLLANTTDGTGGYVGSTSGVALSVWRASFSASYFPTRATQTSTVNSPGGVLQDGASLNLKGLPPSSQGLLLQGDLVQCGTQLMMVTTALNSDAVGYGHLRFSPPLRRAPVNGDPVIINNPMGRFVFIGKNPEWANEPGVFTTTSAEFEEACDV